jgi:hypothetical protein
VDTLYYSSKIAHFAARILASSESQKFEVGAAEEVIIGSRWALQKRVFSINYSASR